MCTALNTNVHAEGSSADKEARAPRSRGRSVVVLYNSSERIGRCTRMRRFFVRFNRSESFVHTRSSVGFTIITSGFEFSVHTGQEAATGLGVKADGACWSGYLWY